MRAGSGGRSVGAMTNEPAATDLPAAREAIIDPRFTGPPGSANGGYACAVVAEAVGGTATVRLLRPPPVGVPMALRRDDDDVVRLFDGEAVVAEGRPGPIDVTVPAGVPPAADVAARAAQAALAAAGPLPFPSCFVCGPDRADDGLLLLPGPTGPGGVVAVPWRPAADLAVDGVVDPRIVWAALDCPSGFACADPGAPTVLASMTAELRAPVHAGRPHVVSAWPLGADGRKRRAASAIHDADGRCLAVAEALWITLREAPVGA